jgi:hypothetical protein
LSQAPVPVHMASSVLSEAAERLKAVNPRLHAAIRDMEVIEGSLATATIAFDGERVHVGCLSIDGVMQSQLDQLYGLALVAELISMEAAGRVGTRDARTWNAACMTVAVSNLRMDGFATPERCRPFDIPMYDGMKAASLYDRMVDLEKAPRQMIGLMTDHDL